MSVKKILKCLLPEFIYGIVTIIFLFLLNGLNEVLLLEQFAGKNDLELLMYNDYQSIKYFAVSLGLALIGGGRIVYLGYHAKEREMHFEEIIATFISIIIILILIILLIIFINNPILRAIITVTTGVLAVGYCIAKS